MEWKSVGEEPKSGVWYLVTDGKGAVTLASYKNCKWMMFYDEQDLEGGAYAPANENDFDVIHEKDILFWLDIWKELHKRGAI